MIDNNGGRVKTKLMAFCCSAEMKNYNYWNLEFINAMSYTT